MKPSASIFSLYFRKSLLLVKYFTWMDRRKQWSNAEYWQMEAIGLLHGASYPLSWTIRLKLALVLLAVFGFVTIVVQAFPQLVSRVPARLPLCGVGSWHPGRAGGRSSQEGLSLMIKNTHTDKCSMNYMHCCRQLWLQDLQSQPTRLLLTTFYIGF